MDLVTPIGIVLAIAALIFSFYLEGGSPLDFFESPGAILLVVGGTLGVALASNRVKDISGIAKAALSALRPGAAHNAAATVNELMGYAEMARHQGLLALEEQVKDIEDPFLRRGLELVIDGTDSDEVADVLNDEVDAQTIRHRVASKFFADMGAFAPTLGILGTVLGLYHALQSAGEDPDKLVAAISVAFLATLWGVMTANLIYLPISNKLKRMSTVETAHRRLLIQGVLAIQAGASPRAVGERLKSHLPPRERDGVGEDDAEKLSA